MPQAAVKLKLNIQAVTFRYYFLDSEFKRKTLERGTEEALRHLSSIHTLTFSNYISPGLLDIYEDRETNIKK